MQPNTTHCKTHNLRSITKPNTKNKTSYAAGETDQTICITKPKFVQRDPVNVNEGLGGVKTNNQRA